MGWEPGTPDPDRHQSFPIYRRLGALSSLPFSALHLAAPHAETAASGTMVAPLTESTRRGKSGTFTGLPLLALSFQTLGMSSIVPRSPSDLTALQESSIPILALSVLVSFGALRFADLAPVPALRAQWYLDIRPTSRRRYWWYKRDCVVSYLTSSP